MSDGPVLKRRRTTAACNSCRAKKSKVSVAPDAKPLSNVPFRGALYLRETTSSVMVNGQYVADALDMGINVLGEVKHKAKIVVPCVTSQPLLQLRLLAQKSLENYSPSTNS